MPPATEADDHAVAVVTQAEPPALQRPGVGAVDRPAALAQILSVDASALVDGRRGFEIPTEPPMLLGVVSIVGEHWANARHDGAGAKKQTL